MALITGISLNSLCLILTGVERGFFCIFIIVNANQWDYGLMLWLLPHPGPAEEKWQESMEFDEELYFLYFDGGWTGWLLGAALLMGADLADYWELHCWLLACTLFFPADTTESCAICNSKLEVINRKPLYPVLSEFGEINSNVMKEWLNPVNPDIIFLFQLFVQWFMSLVCG